MAATVATGCGYRVASALLVAPRPNNCNANGARVIESLLKDGKRTLLDARGGGPCKTLKSLESQLNTSDAKKAWVEEARISAIAGRCPGSHNSAMSGLRLYLAFAERVSHACATLLTEYE